MKKKKINDFLFYKYRYIIGYSALVISYVLLILYTLFVAPNSLTAAEMKSATDSYSFTLNNLFSPEIVNLPFKCLQKLSIMFFGLSNFSIKLPAILISGLSLFGIIKLTNAWFSKGVATFASLIAITSSQFFFLAQNGTPEILHIFYPVILLYLGASFLTAKHKQLFGFLFMSFAALSLYTPLGIYILLALLITIIAHPHLRFVLKKTKKQQLILGSFIFILLLIPLSIALTKDLISIKLLLGIPNSFNILANLSSVGNDLFSFGAGNVPGSMTPILNFASVILIGIGLFFSFSERHSSRSYMINIWTIILLTVCIINPASITILFTPIFLLTVSGLQSLLQSWYTLFPLNPYARITGLLPIIILVGGLLAVNLDNFRLSYIYSPQIMSSFNNDLELLSTGTFEYSRPILIVPEESAKFYEMWSAKRAQHVTDSGVMFGASQNPGENIIVARTEKDNFKVPNDYKLKEILVSPKAENADRFYVYNKK